jgi:hypothetical protein
VSAERTVRALRFELRTSTLSGWRSNQLSYARLTPARHKQPSRLGFRAGPTRIGYFSGTGEECQPPSPTVLTTRVAPVGSHVNHNCVRPRTCSTGRPIHRPSHRQASHANRRQYSRQPLRLTNRGRQFPLRSALTTLPNPPRPCRDCHRSHRC